LMDVAHGAAVSQRAAVSAFIFLFFFSPPTVQYPHLQYTHTRITRRHFCHLPVLYSTYYTVPTRGTRVYPLALGWGG
jgi:hypothetical protein